MPSYPDKKDSQVEDKFEIETSRNKYLLTRRISPSSIMLYIGGPTTYCLECQIENSSEGFLSKIAYDEFCSLTGRFERGIDTKSILSVMMAYIRENYPHVQILHFNDFSTRECASKISVDLPSFYYVLYNQTWYMKNMNAWFKNAKDKELFDLRSKQFQEKKQTMSWNDFDKYVNVKHPFAEEEMRTMFEEAKTWTEYFTNLRNRMDDMSAFCEYLSSWITEFVNRVVGLRFSSYDFLMAVNNSRLEKTDYKIITTGGRLSRVWTRRRPRRRYKNVDLR